MLERITRLREPFLARTASEIETLRRELEHPHVAAEALTHAARIAHGIRGAGASLGFAAVSECAGSIERRIKDLRATKRSPSAEFIDELRALVTRLEQLVARAQAEHRPTRARAP